MATLAPDITLTPAAAARVAWIAARQDKPAILRLSVEGGGCSGFQYKFGLADAAEPGDTIAEVDGAQLLVDDMSFDLVRGCAVDFVDNLGGAHFKVETPTQHPGAGAARHSLFKGVIAFSVRAELVEALSFLPMRKCSPSTGSGRTDMELVPA